MSILVMSLRTWLDARLGRGRRHIVLALALALAANVWALNPAAAHGIFSSNALDQAADTAAIVGVAETVDSAKGQLDDFDDIPFTIAYPGVRDRLGGMEGGAHPQAAASHEWDGFPHKTGPPARS